jgi:arsenate reductase
MAEGLLREMGSGRFETFSAGTEATRVNPLAVRAMAAVGVDIAGARSKHLSEFLDKRFDFVITVCDAANESCPVFPGAAQRIHWSFMDPSSADGTEEERLRVFEGVRDETAARLRSWMLTFDQA